ncbi:hypothetical protein [Mycolicibacterium sp. CBMA 226]|uniref:hypothetical protein n=1 Tax=Mycolicibacterium sp. CBMA 226 TaxID=2606611 RepID=UPI0014133656|nr:hypothetical protein [Mycolicibacterium sp. CBMA 226]
MVELTAVASGGVFAIDVVGGVVGAWAEVRRVAHAASAKSNGAPDGNVGAFPVERVPVAVVMRAVGTPAAGVVVEVETS